MLEGIPIVSRVFAGAYYSNLINFGFLMRNEMTGGKLAYGTCQKPDGIYPGVAMEEDFGKVVAG